MSHQIELRRRRLPVLLIAAAALWIVLPFILQVSTSNSHAQATTNIPDLVARLTGTPNGNIMPSGIAVYDEITVSGTPSRVLHVEVNNIITPVATTVPLGVFLNDANIGTITLGPMGRGVLHLTTVNGDTVPTPVAGDVLSVKNGTTTVLSGPFAVPPTPSPTVSQTPPPTPSLKLWAQMGVPVTAAGTMNPRGFASYAEFGPTNRNLEVYASFIPLPEGTVLNVIIGGNLAGTMTLHNHEGRLRLSTLNGGVVPVIALNTPITIRYQGQIIIGGIFRDTRPTPLPTPSVTPTPHGTPVPVRAFGARLNGHHEVPPVITTGRGFGFVVLNPAGTEIGVRIRFIGLSSAPTAVTINGPAAPDANGPVIFTLNNAPTAGTAFHTFAVTEEQAAQLRNSLWYFQVATVDHPDGEIRGQIRSMNRRDDFDGDGLSDVGVIRSRTGFAPDNAANDWYTLNSSGNGYSLNSIGNAGDVNVQGDYDGDGIADLAMYTPSTGTWQIRRSGTGATSFVRFGMAGDIPVVGDYDGDSVNDLAVYRPGNGNWYVFRSSDDGFAVTHWGAAGDRPVSGDYDGDGVNDLAVFRPSVGDWYINRSTDGGLTAMHWGLNGDQPVAGDFDGDGSNDVAVFRPSDGNWYIHLSSDNGFSAYHFGMTGDVPVACEFDGDGITDIAVFRPAEGNWYMLRSTDNSYNVVRFGIATDRPVTRAYAPQ